MSEGTGLLFAALALFAVSALFRRVFLSSSGKEPLNRNSSYADPLPQFGPLDILYRESQPMQKCEVKQTPSMTPQVAPWQREIAIEVSRLFETEAQREGYTKPLIETIPVPADVVTRAVEYEANLQPQ